MTENDIDQQEQADLDLIAQTFREGRSWGENFYDYVEALHEREQLDPALYHYRLGFARFCAQHQLIPGFTQTANWFGFGELPVAFEDDNDQDPLKTMFWIDDFAKVSGIAVDKLMEWWQEQKDEDRADVYGLTYYCPKRDAEFVRPLLAHSAAMRAMTFLSPWSREFYEATKEMMSHALMKSGLGETLLDAGTGFTALAHMETKDGEILKVNMLVHSFREEDNVPIVRAPWDDAADDELIPITDLCTTYEVHRTGDAVQRFLGPRVSEEEALKMAFRGPQGSLPDA